MKKFLGIVICLVVVFLVMTWMYDRLNLELVRASTGNVFYKMERLFGEVDQDEVPILGSSRAQANFVPTVLGTTCFNYGIDGSGIPETLFHLRYLVERKTTGLILVNLDPWGFRDFSDSPTKKFQGKYKLAARRKEVRNILPQGILKAGEWIPGVRFQGMLRSNLTQLLNARKAVTKIVDRGAVLLKNSRTESEWGYIDQQIERCSFVLPSSSCQSCLDEIKRIVETRDGNLKVVFVVGPCSDSFHKKYQGAHALETWLRSFRTPHVDVIDMFSASKYSVSEFADPTHLNQLGAQRFSRELKELLTKNNFED